MNAIRTCNHVYASICRLRLALSRHLRKWTYAVVGREISRITRYVDRVLHVDPLPSDKGLLLQAIDAPVKQISESARLAEVAADSDAVDVILDRKSTRLNSSH